MLFVRILFYNINENIKKVGIKMGIRDFFNNMFGRKEEEIENNQDYNKAPSSMGIPIEDYINNRTIYLRDVEDTAKHFKYANGEKNTVYKAILWRTDGLENEMLLAAQSYISFELPADMSIDDAIQNGMMSNFLNSGRAQEQNLRDDRVNHLGKINMQTGIVEPSHPAVEKWVKDNLTSELIKRQEEKKAQDAIYAEQARQRENAKKENTNRMIDEKMQYYDNMKKERMQNPRFTNERYGAYRLNNPRTGDIIDLQIIGNPLLIKDSSGNINYYYNANRQDISREDDAINLSNNPKPNLQFSLPYKIEDMCQFANDERYPENSNAIANMMESLLISSKKQSQNLYVGGIVFQDNSLMFADDNQVNEIFNSYVQLTGQNYSRQTGYEDGPDDR